MTIRERILNRLQPNLAADLQELKMLRKLLALPDVGTPEEKIKALQIKFVIQPRARQRPRFLDTWNQATDGQTDYELADPAGR